MVVGRNFHHWRMGAADSRQPVRGGRCCWMPMLFLYLPSSTEFSSARMAIVSWDICTKHIRCNIFPFPHISTHVPTFPLRSCLCTICEEFSLCPLVLHKHKPCIGILEAWNYHQYSALEPNPDGALRLTGQLVQHQVCGFLA